MENKSTTKYNLKKAPAQDKIWMNEETKATIRFTHTQKHIDIPTNQIRVARIIGKQN